MYITNCICVSQMVKGKKLTTEVRMTILEMILERKDVLFGSFSSTLENSMKRSAWEEILVKAKSLEACESARDWIFLRDKMYGQWKTQTLVK